MNRYVGEAERSGSSSYSPRESMPPNVAGFVRRVESGYLTRVQSLRFLAAACVTVGAFVFLYLNLFIFPHTAIVVGDDQWDFLHDAMRMSQGQVIYRDFFEHLAPGTSWFYAIMIRLFGIRAWISNVTLIALGMALTALIAFVSSRVIRGWRALLPACLFLVIFHFVLDGAHHWFSVLFVMAALAALMDGRGLVRVAMAGVLLGVASFFTQNRGALGVIAVSLFLFWEYSVQRRPLRQLVAQEAWLVGAFCATVAVTYAPFAINAGLGKFVWCTIVFPLKYFRAYARWNSWEVLWVEQVPAVHPWYMMPAFAIWLFIHALPCVYVWFFPGYLRRQDTNTDWRERTPVLVELVGLSLLASILYAPSTTRLSAVAAPSLILLVWLLRGPGLSRRAGLGLLWSGAALLLLIFPLRTQARKRWILDTTPGRIAFLTDDAFQLERYILSHVHRSELFFAATDTRLYFTLDLRNPTPLPWVTASNYTRPEYVAASVKDLERSRVRFVLWSADPTLIGSLSGPGDNLGPLREYLNTNYRQVKAFADGFQLFERKADLTIDGRQAGG